MFSEESALSAHFWQALEVLSMSIFGSMSRIFSNCASNKKKFNILVYSDKWEAVEELIIRANYREKNGILTQYNQPTDDYPSMEYLRNKVYTDLVIEDFECFYSIEIVPFNDVSKERLVKNA